jgi:hypothetical protein
VVLGWAALSATGCGAGKSLGHVAVVKAPMQPAARGYDVAVIDVRAGKPDLAPETSVFAGQVVPALAARGLWKRVTTDADAGGEHTLSVALVVYDVNRVTASDRTAWGNAAGQARVAVSIVLTDPATGAVLGIAAVAGTAYGGISGGTTDDALSEAVRQVVRYLAGEIRVDESQVD